MELRLRQNISPANVVDKEFKGGGANIDGYMRDGSSVVDPVFLLELTGGLYRYLTETNYIYAPELNRYYFVRQIEYINNKLFAFYCHCDVLMTYKDYIRQMRGIIQRNEHMYNLYLDDGQFKAYQNTKHKLIKFPFEMNDFSYILALAGNGE